ncbi:MAG: 4Fe-4S dicluster domain-containing protein [Parasporobacterium sp.]|nr:4Fe-4S dicluster domain-containing protein [Parasporobacterium sp.]
MIISKLNLNKALQILNESAQVFVPAFEVIEDRAAKKSIREKKFLPYREDLEVELEGPNTVKPPKDILFPNVEKLYQYKAAGEDSYIRETLPEETPKILFGIRPCDMRSIKSMDKVFFTKNYVDSYYARRREYVTIVAIGCTETDRTCFCDSMGIDPNTAPGADVMMNRIEGEEAYLLHAQTEKGEALLKNLESLEGPSENVKAIRTDCTLKIRKIPDLDRKLAEMFEHPIWDKVTKGCIGCGTCTFVCPTCYCFDIDNENYGTEGCKYRCWDSCMFSDYTRMAGGANPRPTKKERLRNRYMHKLSYFNERYGETLCVGCGRCIANCPSHLDISEFIEKSSAVDPKAEVYTESIRAAQGKEA